MKITIYQSKMNPDWGFSIQEDFGNKYDPKTRQLKKSKDKSFVLWFDEFEGGDAYETDWDYIDEFKSFDEAYEYIIENYGDIEKKAIY